jgi:hypothetical protein
VELGRNRFVRTLLLDVFFPPGLRLEKANDADAHTRVTFVSYFAFGSEGENELFSFSFDDLLSIVG